MKNIKLLELLYSNFPREFDGFSDNGFVVSARVGRTGIAGFLYTFTDISDESINEAFRSAMLAEQPEMLQFVYNTGRVSFQVIEDTREEAIKQGILSGFIFFFENGYIPAERIDSILIQAAAHGQFSIFAFLYNATKPSTEMLKEALLKASLNSHIDVVRHILILNPYLSVSEVADIIRERLEDVQLSQDQAASYREIYEALRRHRRAQLANRYLQTIGASREEEGLLPLPPEINEYIAHFTG